MRHFEELEREVSSWPGVSVHPHRFGGVEFRRGAAEIGHIHPGGIVDIPFPVPIHDALLAEGLAGRHHFVPNSGWITFCIRRDRDRNHTLWLMRLSYLRYALKTAMQPRKLLQEESQRLRLSPRFQSLLEPFVPNASKRVSAERVRA
jgi:hypothetical protein